MATPNPQRGEAALGDQKLSVTFNGFCSLQEATGKDMPALLRDFEGEMDGTGMAIAGLVLDPLALRTWIRCFLVGEFTDEEAGELIGEQGIEEAFSALNTAVQGFFAPMKKEKEANPRKAA